MRTIFAGAVGSALILAAANAAAADPACSSLGGTPIVYIENGDTQENLMKHIGKKLIDSANPVRIVYQNQPTCTLAPDTYASPQKVMATVANRPLRYIPDTSTAFNPDTDTAPICTEDASSLLDMGVGATYLSSCPTLPTTPPAGIKVVGGPIQSYGFIVPPTSQQKAITAAEGYLAFGFADDTGDAKPWTDQSLRFIRSATASTALTDAAAIGLKASQLKGTVPPNNLSSEVLSSIATAAAADVDKAIGLLGTEVYDANRDKVKLLAFKAFNQQYAWFPDKTHTSFDKQNVRDGHYVIWAPTPYIIRVDGGGTALRPEVQRIVDLVTAAKSQPDADGIDQVIKVGLVPQCAMRVDRAFDGAPLASYAPTEPCGCYFESKVPQGSTGCKSCTDDTPCGGGKCRRNFCEAK